MHIFSIPVPSPWFFSQFDARFAPYPELWPPAPPASRVNAELLSAIYHGSNLAVEAFILSQLVSDDTRYSELEFGSVSLTLMSWAAALHHEQVALLLMKPRFNFLQAIGSAGVSILAAAHSNPLVFSSILRQLHCEQSRDCITEHDRLTMFSMLSTSNFTGNSIFHLLSASDALVPFILCLASLSSLPVAEYAALVNVAIEILTCESKNQKADAGMTDLWNKLCAAALRHCCSSDLVGKALRLQNCLHDTAVHVAIKHGALNIIAHVVVRVDCNSLMCADAMGNTAMHLALQTREVCLGLLACLLHHVTDLNSALIAENIIGDSCFSMAVRHPNPHVLHVINYCMAHHSSSSSSQVQAHYSSAVASAIPSSHSAMISDENSNSLGYSGVPPSVCIPDSLLVIVQGSDRPRASILQYVQQYAPSDSVAAFFFAAWCGRRVDCRVMWKKFNSLDSLLIDHNGNGVLHYLATCDSESSVLAHVPGIVSDMAAFGLDFSIKNKYGFTPLHLAIVRSSTHHSSASAQTFAVLMAFLTYSHAALGIADKNMNTVLHLSCFVGNMQMVDVLMSRAVDSTISNTLGLTPLQIALRQGHTEVATLLQDRMTLLLFKAARRQAFQFLLPLLNAGALPIMRYSQTPILHIVAETFSDASRDALRELMDWGIAKDSVETKYKRDVLMHVCSRPPGQWSPSTTEENVLKTVQLLCIHAGLVSLSVDANGQTAFFLSIASRMERVSLWMLNHAGVDPHYSCPDLEDPSRMITSSDMAAKYSMLKLRQQLSQSSSFARATEESSSILEKTMRSMGLMDHNQSAASSLAHFFGSPVKGRAPSFSLESRAATFIQRAFRSSSSRRILSFLKYQRNARNVVRLQKCTRGWFGRKRFRAFCVRFKMFQQLNLLLQSLWSRELRVLHNRIEFKLSTVQHNAATLLQCNLRSHYSRHELTRRFLSTVFVRSKMVVQRFCTGIIIKRRASLSKLNRLNILCCLILQCAWRQHRDRMRFACLILVPHVVCLQCAWRRHVSYSAFRLRCQQSRIIREATAIQSAWRVRCAFRAFSSQERRRYDLQQRILTIQHMKTVSEAEARAEILLEEARYRLSLLLQRAYRRLCARRKASALKFFAVRRGWTALENAFRLKRIRLEAKLTVRTKLLQIRKREAAVRIQKAWRTSRCRLLYDLHRSNQAALSIQLAMRCALAVKAVNKLRQSHGITSSLFNRSPLLLQAIDTILHAVYMWRLRVRARQLMSQQLDLHLRRFRLAEQRRVVFTTVHICILQCALRCHWARQAIQRLQIVAYTSLRRKHIIRLAAVARSYIARVKLKSLLQLRPSIRLFLHILSIHKFILLRRFALYRNAASAASFLQSVARGHASRKLAKRLAGLQEGTLASEAATSLQCCWRAFKSRSAFKARTAHICELIALEREATALAEAEAAVPKSSSYVELKQANAAAALLQRLWRRHSSSRKYLHVQLCNRFSEVGMNDAVITLQRAWRRHAACSIYSEFRRNNSFRNKLIALQCAARRFIAYNRASTAKRMRASIVIQCLFRFSRSVAQTTALRLHAARLDSASVIQRSYRCHRARMHPIPRFVHLPAREPVDLYYILRCTMRALRARREARGVAVSQAVNDICRLCTKVQKVVRGWLIRSRVIRPLLPPVSAAWCVSLQPNSDGSRWSFGAFEDRAKMFLPSDDAASLLRQPSLQEAERLYDDSRAVPEPHVVTSCVAAAAVLKEHANIAAAAGFMLKAKALASRLWSSLRVRFLIWTLDGLAYMFHVGGAVAASAAALDEALTLATGELNRDMMHELLLLTLHLHRILVLLQLPNADWPDRFQKALRSVQESRIILSSLLLSSTIKHASTHQDLMPKSDRTHALTRKSATDISPSAEASEQSGIADSDRIIYHLQRLALLLQRMQAAVVARSHSLKCDLLLCRNEISIGSATRAPVPHSVPSTVLLQPLSLSNLTTHIIAVNASHGGNAVEQTGSAGKCAKFMMDWGITRSSAGALVALLHTHLQMCLQIQNGRANTNVGCAPLSLVWIPSLTLLHLTGTGESALHPALDAQQQGAMRSLADIVVEASLPFNHLDCLSLWMTEVLPVIHTTGSLEALIEAHQLRLQHVGEVLPIRAVTKGLFAVLNCSGSGDIQLLLHLVAAIDASLLALMHSAHCSARQLLQLSDVVLYSISDFHQLSFNLTLATVIAEYSHVQEISTLPENRNNSLVDVIVSANVLMLFLRAASNAIHIDSGLLQVNVQISVFKLCSVAITAQRLMAESQISSSSDFPVLQDCFDRGSKLCSEIRQGAIRIIQACNSTKNHELLTMALSHSDTLCDILFPAPDNENASSSWNQYALQLRLCSGIVRGQLEGCVALHSQAVAVLRLAWDIESLLMYGRLMLMKKSTLVNEQGLRQTCAAAADMLDSDCALHGVDLGDSMTLSWPPLLRKCSGYSSVLHIMRNGHKDASHHVSSANTDSAKRKPPLLLYCVENRESRMQPGSRPVIDITDIKFPSPRRMCVATAPLLCICLTLCRSFVQTMRTAADFASICARRSSYRARTLRSKKSCARFLYVLRRSLPDFVLDAAGYRAGSLSRKFTNKSISMEQPDAKKFVLFNAWKPNASVERRSIERSVHVARAYREPAARGGSVPRTAASESASSLCGFIASDDGGSSAFSDSSDVEVDTRSSVKNRRVQTSAHSSGVASALRRPHTSSGLVGEAKSDSRSLRHFHDLTSSAKSLSTAALLRTLSDNQPFMKPLRVGSETCAVFMRFISHTRIQIEVAWETAGQHQQPHRNYSASATRRVHRESRSKSPAHSSAGRSRPSSAEIPISMRDKSLQMLTMTPKAFMQQQQQQQHNQQQ